MHALVLVVDSTILEIFPHKILENMKILQTKAVQRGKKILTALFSYLKAISDKKNK